MKYLISSSTYLRAPTGKRFYVEPGKQEVNCLCPVAIGLHPGADECDSGKCCCLVLAGWNCNCAVFLHISLKCIFFFDLPTSESVYWGMMRCDCFPVHLTLLRKNILGFHSQLTFVLLTLVVSCHPWVGEVEENSCVCPFASRIRHSLTCFIYLFIFFCFPFLPLSE